MPAAVRWLVLLLVITTTIALSKRSHAADPQPYTVTLKPTGDSALDAALQGSSTLISLQKSAPVAGSHSPHGRARMPTGSKPP